MRSATGAIAAGHQPGRDAGTISGSRLCGRGELSSGWPAEGLTIRWACERDRHVDRVLAMMSAGLLDPTLCEQALSLEEAAEAMRCMTAARREIVLTPVVEVAPHAL